MGTVTMGTATMAIANTSRADLVEGVFPDLVQIGWLVVINVHLNSLLQLLPLCQVVVALQRRLGAPLGQCNMCVAVSSMGCWFAMT